MKTLLLALIGIATLCGQTGTTISGDRTFRGKLEANGASLPAPRGLTSALPATCTQGQVYFATDATAGRNLYLCDSTDHWTQTPAGTAGAPGAPGAGFAGTGTYAQMIAFSASTNQQWLLTDATGDGLCGAGGGTHKADCVWNGATWVVTSGAGGGATPGGSSGQMQLNSSGNLAGQPSVYSSGTVAQRAIETASGTIAAASLTAAAANQEVTIQTGISGNVRYEAAELCETTIFSGAAGLTASMGRPGATTNYEMTGALMPLQVSSGDANCWLAHPPPPQSSGTYNLVVNFAVTTGNVTAAAGSGGVLTWRIHSWDPITTVVSSLSWTSLTNGQWTGLSNGQWTGMSN